MNYMIREFWTNWVYPAYYWRNLLFHRHDLVKIKRIKPWEWCDKSEAMLWANMQLIVDFIDKENPEEFIVWYKDEDGNDTGRKYGEYDLCKLYLPEQKGRYIMNMVKDIYRWWKVERPELVKEKDYLLDYWCDNINGKLTFKEDEKNPEYSILGTDKSSCPKTLEELNKRPNINWSILDKYFSKEKVLDEEIVRKKMKELEKILFEQDQKFLHMCIEVRPYLWT